MGDAKYLLYTSYTYCLLDLSQALPEQVELVQNHPSRSLEGKQLQAKSWFDNLKLSQSKYLSPENQQRSGIEEDGNKNESNLAINNRFKGILLMD